MATEHSVAAYVKIGDMIFEALSNPRQGLEITRNKNNGTRGYTIVARTLHQELLLVLHVNASAEPAIEITPEGSLIEPKKIDSSEVEFVIMELRSSIWRKFNGTAI